MHKIIGEYLTRLGFDEGASRLYEALVAKGPLTILEASRATGIERTALYRQIESLTARGLIEEVLEHKLKRIRAANPEQIRLMLEQEKKRIGGLETSFSEFEREVTQLPEIKSTQVRYYRGTAGLKQIMWNETRAKGELFGYTYRNMEEIAGVAFCKEWVAQIEKNGVVSRDLRSDEFMASTKRPGYERVHINQSAWRYLPDSVMKLSHNLDIYNNVVAIYYWEDNDVFGVEIENEKIAQTQRSIWNTMWGLAEKYKVPEKFMRFREPKKVGRDIDLYLK